MLTGLTSKLCLVVSSEAGKQKRKEEGPSKWREQLVQRKQADKAECDWEG